MNLVEQRSSTPGRASLSARSSSSSTGAVATSTSPNTVSSCTQPYFARSTRNGGGLSPSSRATSIGIDRRITRAPGDVDWVICRLRVGSVTREPSVASVLAALGRARRDAERRTPRQLSGDGLTVGSVTSLAARGDASRIARYNGRAASSAGSLRSQDAQGWAAARLGGMEREPAGFVAKAAGSTSAGCNRPGLIAPAPIARRNSPRFLR